MRSLKRQADGRILVLADYAPNSLEPDRRLYRLEPPGGGNAVTQSNLFYAVVQRLPHECNLAGRLVVVRAGKLDQPARVRLRTVSRTATAGADFVPLDLTLNFAAQERFRPVVLEALPDSLQDDYESLGVELIAESGEGLVLEPRIWDVPIVSQPCIVTLRTNEVRVSEADQSVRIAGQYPVPGSVSSFRFRFRTRDGTGQAGRDYTAVDWTGGWEEWPEIQIHDNATFQGDRDFWVELTAADSSYAVGEPSMTRVTIVDNDSLAGPGRGIRGSVKQLLGASNRRWIVVGDFDAIDGVPVPGFARLLDDGSLDASFHIPAGLDGPIHTALVQGDGKIIIGGRFSRCEGQPVPGVARLLANGGLDPTGVVQSPVSGVCSEHGTNDVRVLFRQPEGVLWVAGHLPRFLECSRSSQLAIFEADGGWRDGWTIENEEKPAALTSWMMVTTGGFLRDHRGRPLPGQPLGQFLPVVPAGTSSSFIMPRFGVISSFASSGFEYRRTNRIDTPEGGWTLFSINAWHPLNPGTLDVLMSVSAARIDEPWQGASFTGIFSGARWASHPTLPVSCAVLGSASDGRAAGVAYDSSALGRLVSFSLTRTPRLSLSAPVVAPDGSTHLAWAGHLPLVSTLERSGDLRSWIALKTNTFPNTSDIYIDPSADLSVPVRYYRLQY